MHYGPHAFAKDYRYPTIEPKAERCHHWFLSGQLDVKGLNLLYKCSGTGPTPKPTPEPEDCVNKNQYCAYWAASGFCFTNNAYMKINCKKSCNFCGTSDCEDQNRYCSSWAKNGQCQQNPKYMSLFCKKSCNLCGAASSSCVDHNSYCQDWSRRQECKRNQAYMSLYCSKSCGSL
ncbi:putative tyrosinase-like protein tyr-3 [Homarus americanus]|uniref:putative tyrosinase-like protein tyr-3 n=1 Tax=Homarus americanus TaxID=6706 RepID=UPI001C4652CE|nr:putative tyrosinase-like protein tyr-3 [Homarus americanus]